MLIAYGDDSSDAKKIKVFAAATVVGRQEDWDDLEARWRLVNGGRPFHATDCESDRGDFAPPKGSDSAEQDANHNRNKQLYADNVQLLVSSRLFGVGVAISIPDYVELFPFAPPDEWPYYMCFSGAIKCAAQTAQWFIPPEHLEVTFDRNRDREVNTIDVYDFMIRHADDLGKILEDKISFADHRKHIGIQVADIVAFETMKALSNTLAGRPRWPRQSLIELKRAQRFNFILYDRAKLESHRMVADALHANPEVGTSYLEWRTARQLPDVLRSRLRFLSSNESKIS